MAGNSVTLFGSDPPTGANSFVQEAFSDITDMPSNNTGWSSTVSSNPMNNLYANDDSPRFGPKTLWIKDLVLEPNRINWINGKPTYRIIWNEPFPSAQGYVFGNVQLVRRGDQTFVRLKNVGDGAGVGGVFARCMFMMVGYGSQGLTIASTAANATGAVAVDGTSNSVTLDWSNAVGPSITNGAPLAMPGTVPMYFPIVADTSNEAYNIHDFRMTANQDGGAFQIAGFVVYSENPSLTIDQFPGVTYNNKTRSTSTANTTLQLPSMGGSLGGVATIWKNAAAGYSMSVFGQTTTQSAATGSSGTNLMTVTTGQGASFSVGNGVISYFGSTPYVGLVQSISTDTLTVFPTLTIGVSGNIYRYFQSGQSLVINGSLNILSMSFGATELAKTNMFQGYSGANIYTDPQLRYYLWGNGIGMTTIDSTWPALSIAPTTGAFQCEGNFNCAEIEWVGMSVAVLSGTMMVNGFGSYNHSSLGFTGLLKKTVFSDAGPGWNSFAFNPDANFTNVAISRINLYQRNRDVSASYGLLAKFDINQAFVPKTTNATMGGPGVFQRLYIEQLMLRGPWVRSAGTTIAGGMCYYGSTTTCTVGFNYFGTGFCVHGLSLGQGGSMNLSLDAGANQGVTSIGTIIGAGSTFHSASLAVLGGTVCLFGIDFYRTYGEMKNLQTFVGVTATAQINPIPIITKWMPYFPSFTGVIGISTCVVYWRRIATDMELRGYVSWRAYDGVSEPQVFMPNGYVADGTVAPYTIGTQGRYGFPCGNWYDANNNPSYATYPLHFMNAYPYGNGLFFIMNGSAGSTNGINSGGNQGNGPFSFYAKVPILGWEVDR